MGQARATRLCMAAASHSAAWEMPTSPLGARMFYNAAQARQASELRPPA